MHWIALACALLTTACCRTAPPSTLAAAGTERGPCYGNGTCNEGLVCLSDLCVRPPPADCAKVAQKVGYLTLSNYAPAAERERFEGETRAACENAMLTREEGECILSASGREQLAKCPKPLGLARCDRIVAHVTTRFADDPRVARFLARGHDRLIEECERENLSQAVEDCVMAAKTFDQIEECDRDR